MPAGEHRSQSVEGFVNEDGENFQRVQYRGESEEQRAQSHHQENSQLAKIDLAAAYGGDIKNHVGLDPSYTRK